MMNRDFGYVGPGLNTQRLVNRDSRKIMMANRSSLKARLPLGGAPGMAAVPACPFRHENLGLKVSGFHHQNPYVEPKPEDSNGPCPMLNILRNHGIVPRDGVVTGQQLVEGLVAVGFDRSMCQFLASSVVKEIAGGDMNQSFPLEALYDTSVEHKASLRHEGKSKELDQGFIADIEKFFETHDQISREDLAAFQAEKLAEENGTARDRIIGLLEWGGLMMGRFGKDGAVSKDDFMDFIQERMPRGLDDRKPVGLGSGLLGAIKMWWQGK